MVERKEARLHMSRPLVSHSNSIWNRVVLSRSKERVQILVYKKKSLKALGRLGHSKSLQTLSHNVFEGSDPT